MWHLSPLWARGQGRVPAHPARGSPQPPACPSQEECAGNWAHRPCYVLKGITSVSGSSFLCQFFTKVLFLLIFVGIIPPQACLTVLLLYL